MRKKKTAKKHPNCHLFFILSRIRYVGADKLAPAGVLSHGEAVGTGECHTPLNALNGRRDPSCGREAVDDHREPAGHVQNHEWGRGRLPGLAEEVSAGEETPEICKKNTLLFNIYIF